MINWIHNKTCNNEDIVLSSRIRLSRNIESLPFPEKLDFIKARENGKKVYDALDNELEDDYIVLHEMWNDSVDNYNKYVKRQLITKDLLKNSNKASFILNKDETISIMINEENHIELQCITAGFDLQEAFDNAIKVDDKIEEKLRYAFDEELGYLTSSIKNLGTGMKASVIIHLPSLTMNKEIDNITKDFAKHGIEIKGLYTDGDKVVGNLYSISNTESIGLSENEIINNVKNAVLSIVSEERKYREILLGKCRYELEDRVYRAYGILKSAVLLDEKETLSLLSDARLGVELSLIDVDKNSLNEILVQIDELSLKNLKGKSSDSKEIKYERAKCVKEILCKYDCEG